MSEPTKQDVEALAEVLRAGAYHAAWILYDPEHALPRAVLTSDWYAQTRCEAAAEALDEAAASWGRSEAEVDRWLRDRAAALRGATP